MEKYLEALPTFVDEIRKMREIVIRNIVLIGEVSAPTFQERRRAELWVERLAEFDPRSVQVVECRFFAGLTVEETARALDIGPATVKRSWASAKAWLLREIQRDPADSP